MPSLHRLSTLWRNLLRKKTVEAELENEIGAYRQLLEEEKAKAGIAGDAVRRETLLELGGAEQIRKECGRSGSEHRWRCWRRKFGNRCAGCGAIRA